MSALGQKQTSAERIVASARHLWAGFISSGVRAERNRCSCGLFISADDRLNVHGLFDAVVSSLTTKGVTSSAGSLRLAGEVKMTTWPLFLDLGQIDLSRRKFGQLSCFVIHVVTARRS
jgi:hypothetical protein